MYSNIYELPSQVKNSLDEEDQKKWMDAFNKSNPKSEDESFQAYKNAWHACKELPSSFSFIIKASMDMVDKDREIIDVDSIKKSLDTFIKHNGNVQYEHGNYNTACVWDWKPIKKDGVDGVEVYGNLYGGDPVYDKMREMFVKGFNSMSVAGEADKGRYMCDDKGCYTRRFVKSLMEISLCKVPANKGCTLSWFHPSSIAKSGGDYINFNVDEYRIHKSYSECPILGLRKELADAGIKGHATEYGVMVDMSEKEYEALKPVLKSKNVSSVWCDGTALLNDRDYMIELSYKDGLREGFLEQDGSIKKSITKEQFQVLFERDVICEKDGKFYLDTPIN